MKTDKLRKFTINCSSLRELAKIGLREKEIERRNENENY